MSNKASSLFPEIKSTHRSSEEPSRRPPLKGLSVDLRLMVHNDSIQELHHQYISQHSQRVRPSSILHEVKNDVSSLTFRRDPSISKHSTPVRKYSEEEEQFSTQISPTRRYVNRPRIVSVQINYTKIPVQPLVQPSVVSRSKKHIFQVLKSKYTDSTFVAVQIKPNLALLRNKGFYELGKAEDILRNSLEQDHKKRRNMIADLERPNNFEKPNVVKLSKILLNRSQSRVAKVEEEERVEISTPVRSVSRRQEMMKLFKMVQPPKERPVLEKDESHQYILTPINKQFYKVMKRQQNRKLQEQNEFLD